MKTLVNTLNTTELAAWLVEFARHPSLTRRATGAMIFPSSHMIGASHMDIDELKLEVQAAYRRSPGEVLEYRESPINFGLGHMSVRNAPLDSAFSLRGATYAFAIVDLTADPDPRQLRNCFATSIQTLPDHPSIGAVVRWDRGDRRKD